MELDTYVVGQRVEVLLIDAWRPGVVENPETSLMDLMVKVTLTPSFHVSVSDKRRIRPA